MSQLQRRQALRLLASLGAAGVAAPVLSACGGSSLGGEETGARGSVKIGLLVPQSGIYKTLGDDMTNGFKLYLNRQGGKFGSYKVDLVTADEGESAASGQAAYDKLVKQDGAVAVAGVVSSTVMGAIRNSVETNEIPLVGANASPLDMTGVKYIWRTSFVNDEPGRALGKYTASQVGPGGKVAIIAANYQAGKDEVGGFLSTYNAAGGKVAGEPIFTPFETTNFQPFLTQVKNLAPNAVYAFYAGGAALNFVKQYAQFGLGSIPLYAPGFLTEGAGLLKAQGNDALGIYTSMNYASDLANEANRTFAVEYQRAHNTTPTTYAMAAYDAAFVIDRGIRNLKGGSITSNSINEGIKKIGEVPSPRGDWRFNEKGTPLQRWYLRQVKLDGGMLSNSVVSELVTL